MKSLRILATWELLQCSYAAGLVSDHGSGSKTEKEKILNFFLHAPPQLAGAPFSDHLAKKKVSPQVFVAFQFYNQCCPESKPENKRGGNKLRKLTPCVGHFFDSSPSLPTIGYFSEPSGRGFLYFVHCFPL